MMGGLARHTDPRTSHAAALTVKVAYLEWKLLEAIRQSPFGLNQDEACDILKDIADKNSISPRFKPLLDKGLIRDVGTRPGHSGKQQRVCVACDVDFVIDVKDEKPSTKPRRVQATDIAVLDRLIAGLDKYGQEEQANSLRRIRDFIQ